MITVWKDGTYKRWSGTDALYAASDPDWLVNIPEQDSPPGQMVVKDVAPPRLVGSPIPEMPGIGDLTKLATDLEAVFQKYFPGRPALAIAFTLPPNHKEAHWVTNVSRQNGIKLFMDTAEKMLDQSG